MSRTIRAGMWVLTALFAASATTLAQPSNTTTITQTTNDCSPAVTQIDGNVTINYNEGSCPGLSRQALQPVLQAINGFVAKFAPQQATIDNLNRLLARQGADLEKSQQEVEGWIAKYAELNVQLEALHLQGDGDYQAAVEHLERGDLDAAEQSLLLLREKLAELDRQELERARERTKKRAAVSSQLARIAELKGNWDEAITLRDEAVGLLPDDFDLRFALAVLLGRQNLHGRAIENYERMTDIAPTPASRAAALNNLGNLYRATNRLAEAEQAHEEALEIRRDLARVSPDDYRPYIATTLNNLAVLYSYTSRLAEAEQAYEEALEIRRDLALANPDAYRPYVATTLNNLANLYRTTSRLAQAEQAHQEALEIGRDLVRVNPDAYRPDVAMTLNNLGGIYDKTNRLAEAEQAYREALEIRRDLARLNPDAYRPDVAMTINNLGNLYYATNRLAEAEQAYREALEIRRDLARLNPDAYRPDLATILYNLGTLYNSTSRLAEAEQAYREALGIYRNSARVNPDAYQPDVAMTLHNLGNLYRATSRLAEAERALKETVELLDPFYQANRGGRGDWWAKSHLLLAIVQKEKSDCLAALATVARTREIVGWERYARGLKEVEEGCGGGGDGAIGEAP